MKWAWPLLKQTAPRISCSYNNHSLQLPYLLDFECMPVDRKYENSGRRIYFVWASTLGILEVHQGGRDRGMVSDE
jgi:hypothetical protein